jgi:copper oxidase (laccase) domain-containing protein
MRTGRARSPASWRQTRREWRNWARLDTLGVGTVGDQCCDTYSEENYFFSFRHFVHRNEPDYGRLITVITLAE